MGSGKKMHSVYVFLYPLTWTSVLHAILIMVQATTLNVAFNSHNKSLLTIMMSNNVSTHVPPLRFSVFVFLLLVWQEKIFSGNKTLLSFLHCCVGRFCPSRFFCFFLSLQFVEIKGSVFKKFEKNNLFQMSNSGK